MKNSLIRLSVLLVACVLVFTACSAAPVSKSGVFVNNTIAGTDKTEYVICVSKNAPMAAELMASINKIIGATDLNALTAEYQQVGKFRRDDPAEKYDLSTATETINVYTTVFEPYQFSGAYGNGVDGIDVILLFDVAHDLNVKLTFHDELYPNAYSGAKDGGNAILATGIALTDTVKNDFLVSDVYSTGYQQIVSDKNQNYTKLEQLKGMQIGVLVGRTGETLVKQAIESGVLKGTGAEMVCFNTDAEAYVALKNEDFDVLVIDELPAKMLVTRGF